MHSKKRNKSIENPQIKEEIKKLSNIDLVGQLISHAHQFGDVIQETNSFVKEILLRLEHSVELKTEEEHKKVVIEKLSIPYEMKTTEILNKLLEKWVYKENEKVVRLHDIIEIFEDSSN